MVGWPWETREDAMNTVKLARKLMTSGLADVLQATVVVPYPGTPLFEQAAENRWFRFPPDTYDHYDMSEAVLTTPDMTPDEVRRVCESIYKQAYLSPQYVWRQLTKIRSLEDIGYRLQGMGAVLGHIRDFGGGPDAREARE
jgi:radical SAM superfamily enzyme YgiQ (UPF0313 family)